MTATVISLADVRADCARIGQRFDAVLADIAALAEAGITVDDLDAATRARVRRALKFFEFVQQRSAANSKGREHT